MIWQEIEGQSVDRMAKIHRKIFPREKILDKELVAFPCNIRLQNFHVYIYYIIKNKLNLTQRFI